MSLKRFNRNESRCIDLALVGVIEKITAYVNHDQPLVYVVIKMKAALSDFGIPKSSWCNISVRTPDDFKLAEFITAIREGKIVVSILRTSLKETHSIPHGKMFAMKAIDSFLNPNFEQCEEEDEDDEPPKKKSKNN